MNRDILKILFIIIFIIHIISSIVYIIDVIFMYVKEKKINDYRGEYLCRNIYSFFPIITILIVVVLISLQIIIFIKQMELNLKKDKFSIACLLIYSFFAFFSIFISVRDAFLNPYENNEYECYYGYDYKYVEKILKEKQVFGLINLIISSIEFLSSIFQTAIIFCIGNIDDLPLKIEVNSPINNCNENSDLINN